MKNIQGKDIHAFSMHSDLSEHAVQRALIENIYSSKEMWRKMLPLFFLILGIGFTVLGVIFFFAYNWEDLHKSVKIGTVEALVLVSGLVALKAGVKPVVRNILLFGSSVLVGALFAVFGQVYQTGADAFDLFLVWALAITVWVVVSDFAPLWLFYLLLLDVVVCLYYENNYFIFSDRMEFNALYILHITVLVLLFLLDRFQKIAPSNAWFIRVVALGFVIAATIRVSTGIFDKYGWDFILIVLGTLLVYSLGIWHGVRTKSAYYLSILSLSLTIIFSALLAKVSGSNTMFLFISLFVIGSITGTIAYILDLKRSENEA